MKNSNQHNPLYTCNLILSGNISSSNITIVYIVVAIIIINRIAIIGELSLFIQHSDGVQVFELQYASG